jgi:hypothetical protein
MMENDDSFNMKEYVSDIIQNVIHNVFIKSKKKSIKMFICGCIKDSGKYLNNVFQNIKKIKSVLDDYHIIMAYDKSKDNSLKILNKYNDYYKDKMSLIIGTDELSGIRTQNIANARNNILNEIKKLDYSDFDYFIMMDMDDVCSKPININVLKYIINTERSTPLEWDSISFNRDDYYDIWALSIHPYTFSCLHYPDGKKIQRHMINYIKQLLHESAKQHGNKGLVPCLSAFNGLSIYRKNKFLNVSYQWNVHKLLEIYPKSEIDTMSTVVNQQPINRHDDCEHRYFHIRAALLNNARICISPMFMFNS